jgi:hypothetical protein
MIPTIAIPKDVMLSFSAEFWDLANQQNDPNSWDKVVRILGLNRGNALEAHEIMGE